MRADRLISILMYLQARGRMTAAELARELEVSERTIYRDLEALHASGVPVLAERGPGGGVELPENYRTNLTGLSEEEVRGLFLSAVPGPLADLGLGKSIEGAVLKLTAALPEAHRHGIEQVRARIHVDTSDWFQPGEQVPHLELMQRAVWQDRRVIMTYAPAVGRKARVCIEPYGLVAKGTVWYVVAGVVNSPPVFGVTKVKVARRYNQVYRISRVQDAELMDEQFERPEGFDLREYWDNWCREFRESLPRYTATMRLDADLLRMLPRLLGEGMRGLIEQAGPPDEEGYVVLDLTFDSFEAARGAVVSMGAGAEVLVPEELRVGVLDLASDLLDLYTREGRDRRARHPERFEQFEWR
jgi:predicted DNA-binding transcriptional regulator YafY